MHKVTGVHGSWEIQTGKIGMHPARRNGKVIPGRIRLIGVMPADCGWVPGDRGMIVPMQGKSPGQGMLYVYPADQMERWVQEKTSRDPSQIAKFKLEDTGRWGVYLNERHPVAAAVRRAVKWQVFGHTQTEVHVNTGGSSMTIRVPRREDMKAYTPNSSRRGDAQGRLL